MRPRLRAFSERFFVALQYQDYRQLWIANAFAQAAAWGLIVTRGWLIYHTTHSSFLVGVTTFAALAPQFIVPPIVGVLADRMDRRTLLSWTYGINTFHNLALLLLASFGVLEVWMLIALSVVNGTARAAQMPTSQALSASLVPRQHLLNALSLSASTQHGSRLIGPGVITPMLGILGAPAGFAVCTVFYVVGWFNILRIAPRPPAEDAKRESFSRNFVDGLQYVYSRPVMRFMILLVILHCGLTMAFESLLPTFSHENLRASDEGFGTLIMGVGAGAFVASLFVSGIQTSKARGNVLVAMGLISGLGQLALSLTTTLWLATISAAFMGGAQAAFMTMGQSVTQSIASEEFRGRVASINAFSLGGIMATMNLLNGSLADEIGAKVLLFGEGLIFASIIMLSLFAVSGRRIYGRGAPMATLEATPEATPA
ncbi:MAG TPA: MFS transporter [Dehalococcoidia bacterium]|nr:MFS transporter [Dehalococcoidia bacterium]